MAEDVQLHELHGTIGWQTGTWGFHPHLQNATATQEANAGQHGGTHREGGDLDAAQRGASGQCGDVAVHRHAAHVGRREAIHVLRPQTTIPTVWSRVDLIPCPSFLSSWLGISKSVKFILSVAASKD